MKTNNFSRSQLTIFALVFALIGGYVLWKSFAQGPLVASIEAEQMTLPASGSMVTDTSASAGKAIKLTTNGTAAGSVNFPSSVTSFTVNAKGVQCSGSPAMTVSVDGTNYLTNTAVASTSWASYSATSASALSSGTHNVAISFTNDYSKQKGSFRNRCSRDLYVDVTNFYGPDVITAAPTVLINANPLSITAGQASTLTWTSTNATSCTGGGAWSGSVTTSGSQSTGALNQTTSYILTCTGPGGTGADSQTVTVTGTTSGGGGTGGGTGTGTGPTETGRWYSIDSPWNTPIPASPLIAPGNSSMISDLASLYGRDWIGPTSSSTPSVAYAQSTTPTVTVQVNYPSCNSRLMQIPIPAGTYVESNPGSTGATSPESHLVIVTPDGTEYDMFKVTPPNTNTLSSGPVCAPTGNWAATVVDVRGPTIGWQSKGDTGPSFRGSVTCAGCGTIRKRDIQAANGTGSMDHALAISYPDTYIPGGAYPSYVYPASGTDGKGAGYPNGIPEGARIQLDPSINCDTWSSLVGQPVWKHTLCKTLQTYGMIVVDTGAGLYMEWYKDSGTDWVTGQNGFSWTNTYLPHDLYSHFRVLDWNWHWTGGNP